MTPKKMFKTTLLLLGLAVLAFNALAQTEPPAPTPGFDDKATAWFAAHFSYWQTLLVPICLVLTTLVKKYVAFILDNLLPFVAPILGGLLDMAATKFGLWTGNGAVGATMGALATWFHQAYTQNLPESDGNDEPAPTSDK